MDLTALHPAARHRDVSHRFSEIVAVVSNWQAPTPVAGWIARDVVEHLVEWFPAFLASGGVSLPAGPDAALDPANAWKVLTEAVQALLDDVERSRMPFSHPMVGTHRLEEAIDRFYTPDVFMHSWDLARAAGVDPQLDERFCAVLLEGMEPMDELLRSSGQFGPRVPVADNADAAARLVAFIGRDPQWTPPE